jgi:predicted small lipoprotein YifL
MLFTQLLMILAHYTIRSRINVSKRGRSMLCWSRYIFFLVVVILGSASMLSACGQKGPLVLPDETREQAQEQTQENDS